MANWDVTTANTSLEFDTNNNAYNSCAQIDDNHFINFWYGGAANDCFVQVFTVNTSTWAVTTAGASLNFDANASAHNSCLQIDSNHFISLWAGSGVDGYVQVFTVNTSTWAVTTANASLEYDTALGRHPSLAKVDDNHFLAVWSGGAANHGYAQVFTVNTSTWAVTTANASLDFTDYFYLGDVLKIGTNHFCIVWGATFVAGFPGYAQVFTVNTSTWAVTTANASLNFDTTNGVHNSCFQIDSNHFINFWSGNGDNNYVQVFTVNTSTWAVTTANARLEFDTIQGSDNSCFQIDSNHFINLWAGSGLDGYVQVFTVDTSTWAVTTAGARLEFDTTNGQYHSCFQIDSNHFINFWQGNANDGYAQVFTVELPGAGPSFLSAWARNSNSVIKVM